MAIRARGREMRRPPTAMIADVVRAFGAIVSLGPRCMAGLSRAASGMAAASL